MLEKFQRFGAAMLAPVVLLAPAGMIIGLSVLFLSPAIMGDWVSDEGSLWFQIWTLLANGGWTIFKQMPLVFALTLPIGLAKFQKSRCCLESLVLFLTFNYFLSTILQFWGPTFNVDFTPEPGEGSKMTLIANIPTLNYGIFGSLIVSGVVVFIHNKIYHAKLPQVLSVFNGSVAVYVVGFFVMIPLAFSFAIVWPIIQDGILELNTWLSQAGSLGVFLFTFLEKALLPFGLHHLIWFPIQYDSILVEGGTYAKWLVDLPTIAASTDNLRDLAPYAGFMLTALSSLFGQVGIAAAFYVTAKPENRKKVLALLIPLVLTAAICSITEPIEYTYLFVAPILFYIHSFLAACLATTVYACGIAASMAGNLFEQLAIDYIPLWPNHWGQLLLLIGIGLCFTVIYFLVFRAMILKFDFKTPGRTDLIHDEFLHYKEDNNLHNNTEDKQNFNKESKKFEQKILEGLGGKDNIAIVTNCMTRLRVKVNDQKLIKDEEYFMSIGAHGAIISGKSIQIIIGTDVAYIRENFEKLL